MTAAFHYVVGFRLPSGAVHANLIALVLTSPEIHLGGVRAILASSAISMCGAMNYVVGTRVDDLTAIAANIPQPAIEARKLGRSGRV